MRHTRNVNPWRNPTRSCLIHQYSNPIHTFGYRASSISLWKGFWSGCNKSHAFNTHCTSSLKPFLIWHQDRIWNTWNLSQCFENQLTISQLRDPFGWNDTRDLDILQARVISALINATFIPVGIIFFHFVDHHVAPLQLTNRIHHTSPYTA